jgi:diguanylate cyclase (GGDEF)-like protein
MLRTPPALALALALALSAAAAAQQPPPGGPGMRPPPPPPPGAHHGPPPPPPPPQVIVLQAPPPASEPGPASAPVPAPTPVAPALPGAVKPFPQLQDAKPPPPLEFGAGDPAHPADAAARADAASLVAAPATTADATTAARLPRWMWLLAAACVLLLVGWRAAAAKSRALGDEAERLARTQRQLQSQHVHLKSQSEHLRQLATNDPLTGIFNRQAFSNELRQVLDHLQRFRRPLNLLLFDMDNFKQVNDGQGHLVGDQAIRMVVGVVQEHLDSDDLFGRFGGDEFMVAIADQPLDKVQQLADAIRLAVVRAAASHVPALGGLSLSIGIAQANEQQGYAAEVLFQRADTALYAAKNSGRNRVVLADETLPPPPVHATATRHLA